MSGSAKWADLAPRVISGIVMIVGGGAVIWAGGWAFTVVVWCLGALMIWEAARMFGATGTVPVQLALLAGAALAIVTYVPMVLVVPLLLAAALSGSSQVGRDKHVFAVFVAWVLIAAFSLLQLRTQAGLVWVVWLVVIVVVSDVAGYFAGRSFGGPKFWPRISPKKTWSGTVAGWLGAAVVGLVFAGPTGAGLALVPISVAVAFAGQMGDIIESAVKRRTGIKDSSNLIPGHGGVLDRLDAMLGAAMLVMILRLLQMLPGLA